MSRFFAVFLLLLSAVLACQAAPTEDKKINSEIQKVENDADSQVVAPTPLTESLPASLQLRRPPSPPHSPSSSPIAQPHLSPNSEKRPDLLPIIKPALPIPRTLSPQYERPLSPSTSPPTSPIAQTHLSPNSENHPDLPPIVTPARPIPRTTSPSPVIQTQKSPNDSPSVTPTIPTKLPPSLALPSQQFETTSSSQSTSESPSQSPQCPSQLPPCPPECQVDQPVSQPPPPKKKTGWKNGFMNLMSVCFKAIMHSFTDLIVVTGEKPPRKSRKTDYILSFGRKKAQLVSRQSSDGNNSDQEDVPTGSVGCVWFKDYRTPAPRHRATCVTGSGGRQCNFCCVGDNLFNCNSCLTINCNPTINCCSCTINVTVVNNINVTIPDEKKE